MVSRADDAGLPRMLAASQAGTAAVVPRAVAARPALAFVGQSRGNLVAWLGQPDLELREGQGSLLQFRRGQCVTLAMVGEMDSVTAIEVSGVDSGADSNCATQQLPRVTLQ